MDRFQFVVAQLGARMHYAVPSILAENAMLAHFYTDFSANRGWPKLFDLVPLCLRTKSLKRMLDRIAQEVPKEKTTAFNLLGLRYVQRLRGGLSSTEHSKAFLWVGKQFCQQVLACGFGNASAVYTFNTAGLEVLQAARRKGLVAVMEQTIAPKRIEVELLETERACFSEWEPDGGEDALAEELADRETAEWDAAHLILCASEFVRDSIAQCGGPVEKCVVVPYGVDIPSPHRGEGGRRPDEVDTLNRKSEDREQKAERGGAPHPGPLPSAERENNRPFRVLTVGAVGLRKGSPYVLEAARRLKGRAEFRMVGHIGVSEKARSLLQEHLELTGPVPRSEIAELFQWADVFLLPSICEGSATVTYEALAHGLPVICTPNTGSVVRDGVDGFIIPIRDVEAMIDRLETLRSQSDLLAQFSANARSRATEFTVAAYGRRLLAALA